MKVFISWSGSKSQKVAQALEEILESIRRSTTPSESLEDKREIVPKESLRLEFLKDARSAIEQIGKITNPTTLEVVTDAPRTYEWILRQQAANKKIVTINRSSREEQELVNFITDRKTAHSYFSETP
jgi:hypothetical protein